MSLLPRRWPALGVLIRNTFPRQARTELSSFVRHSKNDIVLGLIVLHYQGMSKRDKTQRHSRLEETLPLNKMATSGLPRIPSSP